MDDFNPPDLASPEGIAQHRGWLAGIRFAVTVAQGCSSAAEVVARLEAIKAQHTNPSPANPSDFTPS